MWKDPGISKLLPVVVAVLIAIFASDAHAICDMKLGKLSDVRFRGSGAYDVYAVVDTAQTVFFEVSHKASDACSYFVTFSKGQAGTYDRAMTGPGSDLNYQFYDAPSKSTILKEIPEAASSEVLIGTFSTGKETQERSFYVTIPPAQIVLAGDYQDTLTVKLYEGTLSSYTQRDSQTFSVRTEVEQVVQMCVVGCGAPFDPFSKSRTMAFGLMDTGDSRAVDLLVRGNVDYEVTFSSDNKGVMAQLSGKGEVPYDLTVNGAPVNLGSSDVLVATGRGPTPMDGVRYHLEATIGNLATALAGDYRDNIAITVRAK